jgi:membrane-associated protein
MDLSLWLHSYGVVSVYLFLGATIFAETGLFFGFFLPGDSVLIPAGILASQGYLNVYLLCGITFGAAVAGNVVGYYFGKHIGKRIFNREDSLFFHRNHIARAHAFYEKYGAKTILIARFLPVIRTFAPIVAGASEMDMSVFLLFSSLGALLWAIGLPLAGFYLGKAIPDFEKIILPAIVVIVLISLLPAVYEILKHEERREKTMAMLKYFFTSRRKK